MTMSVITMSVWQCQWYLIIVVLTSNFKSLLAAWGSWANVELHLTTDTFNQLMNANYQFQNQYTLFQSPERRRCHYPKICTDLRSSSLANIPTQPLLICAGTIWMLVNIYNIQERFNANRNNKLHADCLF